MKIEYCHITDNEVYLNGTLAYTDSLAGEAFLKSLYKQLGLNYPKFHKMDSLSKAAIIGVELLRLDSQYLSDDQDDSLALLFANSSASTQTDVKFEASYKEGGLPSPALFVYTLPNIAIGELSIRYKWRGHGAFLIQPSFHPENFIGDASICIQDGAKACLCGWVEIGPDDVLDCVFFIVNKDTLYSRSDELLTLYQNYQDERIKGEA